MQCFLSEHAVAGPRGPVVGVVMSERSPGPGWVDFGPVAQQPAKAQADSSKLLRALAKALSQYGPSVPLKPQPATRQSFTDLVDSIVASEKIPYAEAMRRVSSEQPELYNEYRQTTYLSDTPRGLML